MIVAVVRLNSDIFSDFAKMNWKIEIIFILKIQNTFADSNFGF